MKRIIQIDTEEINHLISNIHDRQAVIRYICEQKTPNICKIDRIIEILSNKLSEYNKILINNDLNDQEKLFIYAKCSELSDLLDIFDENR